MISLKFLGSFTICNDKVQSKKKKIPFIIKYCVLLFTLPFTAITCNKNYNYQMHS